MKNKILAALFLSVCLPSFAQTFVEQKRVYPVVESDGHRIVTGFQPFEAEDTQILSNSMKWVIENVCQKGRDQLFDVKTEGKTFSFNLPLDYVVNGKAKYSFNCKVNIRVVDAKLVYSLYDIEYKANSLIALPSESSLDRLNPEKKPKQKEIIDAFQALYSNALNKIFDAVVDNACKPITHWSDINFQRPVKGMNEDECTLAFGIPNSKYEDTNGRNQWSYGLNFVLIFKDGTLETIIR